MSKKRRKQKPGTPAKPAPNGISRSGKQSDTPQVDLAQSQLFAVQQHWQGPLPAPQQLHQFNAIVPGSAERIIRMAEQEGEHTRHMEKREQRQTHFGIRLGQVMAFTITAGGILSSIYLALHGHDNVAMVIGGVPLAAIVVAFLQGKTKRG